MIMIINIDFIIIMTSFHHRMVKSPEVSSSERKSMTSYEGLVVIAIHFIIYLMLSILSLFLIFLLILLLLFKLLFSFILFLLTLLVFSILSLLQSSLHLMSAVIIFAIDSHEHILKLIFSSLLNSIFLLICE